LRYQNDFASNTLSLLTNEFFFTKREVTATGPQQREGEHSAPQDTQGLGLTSYRLIYTM